MCFPLKMKIRAALFALCALGAFAASAAAQTARWTPASGSLAQGSTARLSLVFENCKPESPLPKPAAKGLLFQQPNLSQTYISSFNTGADTTRQEITLSYPVHVAAGVGETVTIPPFSVRTDKGTLPVSAVSYTVAQTSADSQDDSLPLKDAVNSVLVPPKYAVWAGEVFPLIYSIARAPQIGLHLNGNPNWENPPLLFEEFPRRAFVRHEMRGSANFFVHEYATRAMAARDGVFELPPVAQKVVLVPGRHDFFGPPPSTYRITSAPGALTVKPLPQPAPPHFSGAVGQFELKAKVVPEKAAVGEPVTWTLELSGTGNWPSIGALPARELSRDFRVVQPRAKKTSPEGVLFTAVLTEDVVAIPTRPGRYTLDPVEMSVFNPHTGKYATLRTQALAVEITAPAGNATAPRAPADANAGTPPAANIPADAAGTPPALPASSAPPPALPKDPLPSAPPAASPFAGGELLPRLLAALLWPFPAWLLLAGRRALRSDPARPRRKARIRLGETLHALDVATKPGTSASAKTSARLQSLLLAWQRDAAALWGVTGAAPSANEIPDARWAALWRDANRALYLPGGELPPAWLKDARRAWTAARPPRFNPRRALFARNLFPFFFALALLVSAGAAQGAENENPGAKAYASADFRAAEQYWRECLSYVPADWSSRHNLSLALAQQNRWDESAAHAAAAFLGNPRSEAIRWQLRLALSKTGSTPAPLAPLLDGAVAAQLTPARWQHLLVAGAALAALAFVLALARFYEPPPRKRPLAPALLFAAAAVALAWALAALKTYGILADTRTALVWQQTALRSTPTEAGDAQQTVPVPAGSAVLVEKEFLGWRRVSFENGQTGWLRSENLVPLWK
jgi:tetratricopeptide (TPR) repeat protein